MARVGPQRHRKKYTFHGIAVKIELINYVLVDLVSQFFG